MTGSADRRAVFPAGPRALSPAGPRALSPAGLRAANGPLGEQTVRDAVQAALATEHAAIWSYGLASAYLPPDVEGTVNTAGTAHRGRRDAVGALLSAAGVAPVTAAAAYRTPRPVVDTASGAALLVVAEEDVAAAWRAVCERTEPDTGRPLRTLAIDGVVGSARVAVTWRRLARTTPAVPTFPGSPTT